MGERAHGVNGREFSENCVDTACQVGLPLRTMKRILSLLMCYVFLQAETFALRGGPSNSGSNKVTGSYSGVLIDTGSVPGTSNMGLFLLDAASAGTSTGSIVIFSSSAVGSDSFNANMVGLSDTSRGGSGTFTGVFSGAAATTSSGTTKSLSGQMTCNVDKNASNNTTQRITGTANSRTLTVITSGAATGVSTVDSSGNIVTSNGAYDGTLIGPNIVYTIDGWQTNGTNGVPLVLQ